MDRATALTPDEPQVHLVRGILRYHGFLDYEGALTELREVARLDPGRAEAYEWMGYVQRRSGRLAEGIASLEQALKLDPQSGRLMGGLAETYNGAGRYRDAVRLAERAVDETPGDWGSHNVLVQASLASGDTAAATERVRDGVSRITVERILVDRPDLLRQWLPMMSPAVRRTLDPFPALAPSFPDTAGYYLARAHVRHTLGQDARADFDSATAGYKRRRAARPDDPWLALGAALAYAGQGRRDEAVRAGEAAVALFANDTWEGPGAHDILAKILWQFGERDRAAAEIERFIAAQPSSRDLMRFDRGFAALREHPRVRQLIN